MDAESEGLKSLVLPTRRTRLVYLIATMVVMIAGLSSRRYREHLPAFLAEYAGDTLWGLMLFLLISALLADRSLRMRATTSLALAGLVEVGQLYHAPWIDAIRDTTLGGLVLGFGFLWTDLVCYTAGIVSGAGGERAVRRFGLLVPEKRPAA